MKQYDLGGALFEYVFYFSLRSVTASVELVFSQEIMITIKAQRVHLKHQAMKTQASTLYTFYFSSRSNNLLQLLDSQT